MVAHHLDPALVGVGIEPETSVGAGRLQQPVATLPGPQELRRDARPPAQLADPEIAVPCTHRWHCTKIVQSLDNLGTNLYLPWTKAVQGRRRKVKALDLTTAVLLIVGGLNWGLVAIAEFDLVAAIVGLDFGETNALSRIVYGLVGLSAVYQAGRLPALVSRERRDPRAVAA
jgi:uncharacterized membrane protein YuzA (DUF378 family)